MKIIVLLFVAVIPLAGYCQGKFDSEELDSIIENANYSRVFKGQIGEAVTLKNSSTFISFFYSPDSADEYFMFETKINFDTATIYANDQWEMMVSNVGCIRVSDELFCKQPQPPQSGALTWSGGYAYMGNRYYPKLPQKPKTKIIYRTRIVRKSVYLYVSEDGEISGNRPQRKPNKTTITIDNGNGHTVTLQSNNRGIYQIMH